MPHSAPSITQTARGLRRRIGGNLHAARAQRHMTMPKLARLSGLSPDTIDQIELGQKGVMGEADLHTLLRLCAVLNVDFAALLLY